MNRPIGPVVRSCGHIEAPTLSYRTGPWLSVFRCVRCIYLNRLPLWDGAPKA